MFENRKAALTVAVLIFALLAAGCAQPTPQVIEKEVPVEVTKIVEIVVEPTPAPKEPVTIRMQMSTNQLEAQDKMKEWAAQFGEENPGINVVVEFLPWDQLRQSLLTSGMAGTLPDIVHGMSSSGSLEMYNFGTWADLSEYMTPEWIERRQFVEGAFDEIGSFGVPFFRPVEGVSSTMVHALQQAGVEPPPVDQAWTREEFLAAAQQLTIPGRWGWADRGKLGFIIVKSLTPYFYAAGEDVLYEKDGQVRSGFELPEVQETFKFIVDLYREYEVKDPGSLGWGFAEVVRAWEDGAMAMVNIGEWFAVTTKKSGEFKTDWDVMLFPVKQGHSPVVIGNAVYLHVTQQSAHKDEAWKFVDYMSEPERMGTWAYLDNQSTPATYLALKEPQWVDNTFVWERTATWAKYATHYNPRPDYFAIWDSVVGPVTQDAILGIVTTDALC